MSSKKRYKEKKYVPLVTKVSLSSSFVARAICRQCGEPPIEYYSTGQPTSWVDPHSARIVFDWYKKYVKNLNSFWYKKYQPRHFDSIKEFGLLWIEKSYKPTKHQHIGVERNATVEFLTCPCGASVWAFSQKSAANRIEIKNRKARYTYPRKFQSY